MLGRTLTACSLSLLPLATPAPTVARATPAAVALADHKDERLGFSIRLPNKWGEIPLRTDEHWVVGKWTCDKIDYYTDPDAGLATRGHRSELRTVAFIDEVINRPDFEEDEEDVEGRSVTRVRISKVYRDYPDYLRGTFREGFYISKEETSEHKGIPITTYEARIETATGAGNRLLVAWVFDLDIVDVAIEFDVLEEAYDKKRKNLFERTLKSFKEIPRTIPIDLSDYDDSMLSLFTMEKMDPVERGRHRKSRQDREWQKIVASLPDDWEVEEIDGIRVVHKVDHKYAKKVCDRINAVQAWLDQTFSQLGPDEYVHKPIVRICADREERSRFWDGKIMFGGTQIITWKDTGGATGTSWEYINQRTVSLWFQDRDFDLWAGLPTWLRYGVNSNLEAADVKRGKVKFRKDWLEMYARSAFNEKGPLPVRDLLLMSDDQFEQDLRAGDVRAVAQSATLVRYLLEDGRGAEKTLLAEYIAHVEAVLAEISAERAAKRDKDSYKAPETEEEEEARIKARSERIKANQRRILEQAYERSFKDWTPSQMSAFEKRFLKTVG